MRRTLAALLIGIALGVGGTFAAVEVAGGWWEYALLDEGLCRRNRSLGVSHVAPHQPNPCLIRTPKFSIGY